MANDARIKDHWAEQRMFLARMIIAGILMAALTVVILTRLVQLQLVQYDYFSTQSQGNRIRLQPVVPTRGLILDRNGNVLAENRPSFALELVPEQVPDLEDTLARLRDIGLVNDEALAETREEIRQHRRFDAISVRDRLSDEEVARFAVNRPWFEGVEIKARLSRHYPHGQALAHALGYVGGISADDQKEIDEAEYAGTSHIGKVSVERSFEPELHGVSGQEQVVVNARGRSLDTLDRTAAQHGADVVLGIDLDAQLAAWQALEGRRGAAVAIDPATGEILVFVSTPAFDPNALSAGLSRKAYNALLEDIDKPMFNRALRGTYPPGSTIKPMVALAALQTRVKGPTDRIACRGYYQIPGNRHRYRDWKPEGHGAVDMIGSIEQSCDVYYYSIARDIGIERLSASLKRFGLGAATGLDMPGEKGGVVPSPEWKRAAFSKAANQVWFPGETVITGIGQGFMLVTPLQLAHATATIASRGKRYRPTMLHALRDPVSGRTTPLTPEALPGVNVDVEGGWDTIIEGMHAVMHGPRGTARAVGRTAAFQMAGKSGTAQVFTVAQNQKYRAVDVAERLRDHALFVAFGPLEDPKIAVAIIVENGESGSRVAGPIARRIMEAYLRVPAA
ncbi:MAG: penicillin-binding protein 2 [Gammaproteobacteria bacterium]|nr:penicillin-binding protein 2 [Gammaproteobacteria bacterium]